MDGEILATNPWKVSANASTKRCWEDAQSKKVWEAGSFAPLIQLEVVACVLAMKVVERVVCVPLIQDWPNARALETGPEAELPPKHDLNTLRKGTRRGTIRNQSGVKMIIRRTEGEKAPTLALRDNDASNDADRARRSCERTIILEPHRDVESNRLLAVLAPIERPWIEPMGGRQFAEAMRRRRGVLLHWATFIVRRSVKLPTFSSPRARESK